MDKELATKIMIKLKKCREAIGDAEIVCSDIDDEKLNKEIRRVLAGVSLDIYTDAMGKIIHRYPELNPYKDDS